MSAITSTSSSHPLISPTEQTGPDPKLAKSCKEFEANLWRQVLDKALGPLLASSGAAKAPGADVYSYFLSSTIAERVSGSPGGFSSMLQAQLAAREHPSTHPPTPLCTKAAIP